MAVARGSTETIGKPQLCVAEKDARDMGVSFSIADLVADADYAREVARKLQEDSEDGRDQRVTPPEDQLRRSR